MEYAPRARVLLLPHADSSGADDFPRVFEISLELCTSNNCGAVFRAMAITADLIEVGDRLALRFARERFLCVNHNRGMSTAAILRAKAAREHVGGRCLSSSVVKELVGAGGIIVDQLLGRGQMGSSVIKKLPSLF